MLSEHWPIIAIWLAAFGAYWFGYWKGRNVEAEKQNKLNAMVRPTAGTEG